MAITTLDGVIAGMQPPEAIIKIAGTGEAAGVLASMMYVNGRPGAGVAPAGSLGGSALTGYSGQVPYANPSSGNGYLARFAAASTVAGRLMLADRLWHNASIVITTTTAQTINSSTWPARCPPTGDTTGNSILVALEVSAPLGNGVVTNTTMSYTNQAGVSGRTATIASFPATAVVGTFIPFALQAGDSGVRSIQSLTLGTTYVSGTMHLVAYRLLAEVDCVVPNVGGSVDALSSGFPRLFDNTVPFLLWLPSSTTAPTITGNVIYCHG